MDKEKALENQGSKFREDIIVGGGFKKYTKKSYKTILLIL